MEDRAPAHGVRLEPRHAGQRRLVFGIHGSECARHATWPERQVGSDVREILGGLADNSRVIERRPELLSPRRQDRQGAGKMSEDEIGKLVVDGAVKIHQSVGSGLLETVYEVVLAFELRRRGLRVERQIPIPVTYAGFKFEEGFRVDLIV